MLKQKTHRRFQRWVVKIFGCCLPEPPIAVYAMLRHDAAQPYDAVRRLLAVNVSDVRFHPNQAAKLTLRVPHRQALIMPHGWLVTFDQSIPRELA